MDSGAVNEDLVAKRLPGINSGGNQVAQHGVVRDHSKDDPALSDDFLEAGLGVAAQCLQGVASCHCAVGINDSGDFSGDEMALEVGGHR